MSIRETKFNHEENNFHLAIGINEETKNICRERIFFTSFSNSLQADELFDDIDEVPQAFRTVTGDLERLLSMITNPKEYEYTLLTFMMYQRMAKEVYTLYKHTNEDSAASTEDKIKMQIIKSIMKLKELKDREESGEEENNNNVEVLSKESFLERIKFVKKSGYNFDKYLVLVRNQNIEGMRINSSDFDINDLLSGLFSNTDDDK